MSKRVCVNAHNTYRRQHGVPDVAWDPVLARAAKKVVDHNAAHNVFAHSSGQHPYGENIAAGMTPKAAIDAWAAERDAIPDDIPDGDAMFNYAGHFTAMVWKDTARIGCARRPETIAGYAGQVVCLYDPPGNYTGSNYKLFVPPRVKTGRWSSSL